MDCYNSVLPEALGAIDDRFCFAPKDIVYKVWDYTDKKVLEGFSGIGNDESFVYKMIKENNIRTKHIKANKLILRREG